VLDKVLHLAAGQVSARADRYASTLPFVARMGAAAVSAELELFAVDHDKLLEAVGLEKRSCLHVVARRLPGAVEKATDGFVRVARFNASALSAFADLVSPRTS